MTSDGQDSGTTVLSLFYSANEEQHEDVVKWGMRPETLMHKAWGNPAKEC